MTVSEEMEESFESAATKCVPSLDAYIKYIFLTLFFNPPQIFSYTFIYAWILISPLNNFDFFKISPLFSLSLFFFPVMKRDNVLARPQTEKQHRMVPLF